MNLIIGLVLVGVALYIINLIPMEATVKKIVNIVVIVFVCVWALQSLGFIGALPRLR